MWWYTLLHCVVSNSCCDICCYIFAVRDNCGNVHCCVSAVRVYSRNAWSCIPVVTVDVGIVVVVIATVLCYLLIYCASCHVIMLSCCCKRYLWHRIHRKSLLLINELKMFLQVKILYLSGMSNLKILQYYQHTCRIFLKSRLKFILRVKG